MNDIVFIVHFLREDKCFSAGEASAETRLHEMYMLITHHHLVSSVWYRNVNMHPHTGLCKSSWTRLQAFLEGRLG